MRKRNPSIHPGIKRITIWAEGYISNGKKYNPSVLARIYAIDFHTAVATLSFAQDFFPICYYNRKSLETRELLDRKIFNMRSNFYIPPGIHLFDNLEDASRYKIDVGKLQ